MEAASVYQAESAGADGSSALVILYAREFLPVQLVDAGIFTASNK